MWSISSCSKAAIAAALVGMWGTIGIAVERMALPAFTLTSGDGASVASNRLVQPGAWALIYVRRQCLPCESVLRSIDRAEHPALARRLVIVIAESSSEELREEAARYPDLSEATWLADASNAVPRVIGQTGAPSIFGMRDKMIEWNVAGVLIDPADPKSILVNWIEK